MRLSEVLSIPALRSGRVVAAGDGATPVRSVHLAESAGEVDSADAAAALILTGSAAAAVRGYRLDVLMSRARNAGVPLVVLPCEASHLPQPADDLASDVCVVAVDPAENVGNVVTAVARELSGRDGRLVRTFQRAWDTLAALARDPLADAKLPDLLTSDAMTLRLQPRDGEVPAGWVAEPADADRHWLIHPVEAPLFACRLIVQAATALLLASQDQAATPDRGLATLLAELLSGDTTLARELRHRAQALGFHLEGWHLVLAVEVAAPDRLTADLERIQLEESVKRIALRHFHTETAAWAWAQRGNSLLFVRTWTREPNRAQLTEAHRACQLAFDAVRGTIGSTVRLTAGRSGPHPRLDGLRRAAAEARSAGRAHRSRAAPGDPSVAVFDEFGLERALIDWYLSETGTMAAGSRLAPLTELPPSKSDPLLRTLSTYLDHQGSITETAQALFLHRNAVRYRIDQIKQLLGSDLSDPDERLSLHLACRGWALTASQPR